MQSHTRLRAFSLFIFLGSCIPAIASASDPASCAASHGRSVQFATSKGSQMNLDVSPDGRSIAFDLLGDIYILPIEGGVATRLTSGFGWDVRPVWSPDGAKIAFLSDRAGGDQAFIVNVSDGRIVQQITSQADWSDRRPVLEEALAYVEWVPDGTHVIVNGKVIPVETATVPSPPTPTNLESVIYHGSSLKPVIYHGSSKSLFYFMPGTSSKAEDAPHGVDVTQYEAWQLGSSLNPTRLTDVSAALDWSLEPIAVSPDARWLVYRKLSPIENADRPSTGQIRSSNRLHVDTIRVFDSKTGQSRVLIGPKTMQVVRSEDLTSDSIGFSAPTRMAIAPDAKYLFVSYAGRIHKVELASGEDIVVPMAAVVDQCLTQKADTPVGLVDDSLKVKSLRSVTQSPDGKQLVFSALRKLYVQDSSGTAPRVLRAQLVGQFEPSLSPDGRWIAYVTWDDLKGGHLWRMKLDGSEAQQLTRSPGYYQSPAWSPDGQHIAFVGSEDVAGQQSGFNVSFYEGNLQLLSLRDFSVRTLQRGVRLGTQVSFSGNGSRVNFTPYDGGSTPLKLASVALDGTGFQDELLDRFLNYYNTGLSSATVSPDGSDIAIVVLGNIYLVHCPKHGGKGSALANCRKIQVTREGGNDPKWQKDGSYLEWSFADTYYRARLSDLVERGYIESSNHVAVDRLAESGQLLVKNIDLEVPRSHSDGSLVLTGATIVTMRGDEVIPEGTVVIERGRIVKVGSTEEIKIPVGAKSVDLHGKFLIPGLIDAHAHLDMPRDLLVKNHWQPLLNLAFGLTTIRDPSNGGDHAFAYAELVETGDMVGPRMFSTTALVNSMVSRIDSLEDALNIAVRYRRLGATFLKYHTGFNRLERRWIFDAARQEQLNVASHLSAKNYWMRGVNLSTIFDGASTSEHEVSSSSDTFDDVEKYMIESGVLMCQAGLYSKGGYAANYWNSIRNDIRMQRFYRGGVPTDSASVGGLLEGAPLLPLYPRSESDGRLLAAMGRRGQVMMGSHGDYQGIGVHFEMWAHVRAGLTPHQVLRAATLIGARGIGADADLGSLEVGKMADLLVLDKNPLTDIRNSLSIETVVKSGIARDSRSLARVWSDPQPVPAWRDPGIRTEPASEEHVH